MKLIKLNDQFYVVDNSEIKEGDTYLYENKTITNHIVPTTEGNMMSNDFHKSKNKITHSTQQLEGVELLNKSEIEELVYGYNVEKLANERYEISKYSPGTGYLNQGYKVGFQAALEINKDKLFTIEDLIRAYDMGSYNKHSQFTDDYNNEKDKEIQKLLPKTEWEIEIVDGKIKLK